MSSALQCGNAGPRGGRRTVGHASASSSRLLTGGFAGPGAQLFLASLILMSVENIIL